MHLLFFRVRSSSFTQTLTSTTLYTAVPPARSEDDPKHTLSFIHFHSLERHALARQHTCAQALLPIRVCLFTASLRFLFPVLFCFENKIISLPYTIIPSCDRLGRVGCLWTMHIERSARRMRQPCAMPCAEHFARFEVDRDLSTVAYNLHGSALPSTAVRSSELATHTAPHTTLSIYLYALLISSWCAMGPCRALVHRRMGGAGTHTVTGSLLGSHRCQAVPVHVDSCAGTCDVGLPATRRTTQLDQGVVPRCRYTPYDLGTA